MFGFRRAVLAWQADQLKINDAHQQLAESLGHYLDAHDKHLAALSQRVEDMERHLQGRAR